MVNDCHSHSLTFEGCTGSIAVVITPLIALMVDQKKNFTPTGVSVEFVGEAQEDDAVVKKVLKGDVQLVYISPESILNNKDSGICYIRAATSRG